MSIVKVMKFEELWDGEFVGIEILGFKVLLIRIGNEVFAYEDKCPHKGVQLSKWGECSKEILTCQAHGWQFLISSGCGVNPSSAKLNRYPVQIKDGYIFCDFGELK